MGEAEAGKAKPGDLIEYIFEGKNTPALYNGVRVVKESKEGLTAADFKIPTESEYDDHTRYQDQVAEAEADQIVGYNTRKRGS